jgi:fibronectin type 3 domain-containing protein
MRKLFLLIPLLALPANAQHSATLNWTQSVVSAGTTCTGGGSTAVTSNKVYRSTTSGGEGSTPLATFTAATTYVDSAVSAGITYFYQLTSVNCNGESAKSVEIAATIPNPLPPAAPTGLTATPQ